MINEIMKRLSELPNVTLSDGQEYIQLYDAMETIKRVLGKESKTDVFDKIRAEIAELHLIGYATVDGKREIASRAVMQIIDKYKAESEDK